MPMIYLACPYWHEDPAVREARVVEADKLAAHLMSQGHNVYSPLSMNHRIKDHGLEDATHDFWMSQDLPWMAACDMLVVLCIDGWKESKGVGLEIHWAARQLHIPIEYVEPRKHNDQSSNSGNSLILLEDPREPSAPGVRPGEADGTHKLH